MLTVCQQIQLFAFSLFSTVDFKDIQHAQNFSDSGSFCFYFLCFVLVERNNSFRVDVFNIDVFNIFWLKM